MEKELLAELDKAYYKNFKSLSKHFFKNKETGLIFFIEYLRYLRDHLVLESEETNTTKLATLVTAIAEFDAYVINKDSEKRIFHWNNFCELVKLNMEDWLISHDPV
jgi:hypothetical protein